MSRRPWWLPPPRRMQPLVWFALGAAMLAAEYVAGPAMATYQAGYFLPVILAAWYSGKWPALALAAAVPLFRFIVLPSPADNPASFALSTAIRGVAGILIGLWFARLADHERSLETRVHVLEGLLPICSFCKSIRNAAGEWERLEGYITRRSTAEFSHGMCPSCTRTHYADF